MKINATITSITHEDLVSLLSTATYGSSWLSVWYGKNYYIDHFYDDKDCVEDRWVKMLLNGQTITLLDNYAENEEDCHGGNCHAYWDEEDELMCYTISLEDVKKGLENIINGRVHCDEDETAWLRQCLLNLISNNGDLDLGQAENIMQVIMFNEVIYG